MKSSAVSPSEDDKAGRSGLGDRSRLEPATCRERPGKNTIIGGQRPSQIWSEDARANISFIEAKLKMIAARHSHDPECSDDKPKRQQDSERQGNPPRVLTLGLRRRWVSVVTGQNSVPESIASVKDRLEIEAIREEVAEMLRASRAAADGDFPVYRRRSWWSGANIECAYKNLHYAEAALARLYDGDEIRAEIPDAVRRTFRTLPNDDPTRESAGKILAALNQRHVSCTPEQLSTIISIGHEAADRQRAKLRTFRNVLFVGIVVTTALLIAFIGFAARKPDFVSLCFSPTPEAIGTDIALACPTKQSTNKNAFGASSWDVLTVAVLGTIGGALSAAVFIRGLYTNPTPYNVAIPLAVLKIPSGAMAAVVGLLLLAGDFIPGFTAIDKQQQIIAYAILFGFAQQLFTQMIDQRAKNLIEMLPTKARDVSSEGDKGNQ